MNKGRIEQIASPSELYDRPATRFVASFIGTMNVFEAQQTGAGRLAVGSLNVEPQPSWTAPGNGTRPVTVAVRPEDVMIVEGPVRHDGADVRIEGTVFHGRTMRLHAVLPEGTRLTIDSPRRQDSRLPQLGDVVTIAIRPGTARVLEDG
jgi:spermidine/putrescine transport system ATP-binding protein